MQFSSISGLHTQQVLPAVLRVEGITFFQARFNIMKSSRLTRTDPSSWIMHDLWQHNFMTLVLNQLFLFLVD